MMDAWDFLFATIFFCIAGLAFGGMSQKARSEFIRTVRHDSRKAEQAVIDLRIAGISMIVLILLYAAFVVYWMITGGNA
jgi:hypothetical protein